MTFNFLLRPVSCVFSELWFCATVSIQNSTKLMNNVHCHNHSCLIKKNPNKPTKQNQSKVKKQVVHFERLTVMIIVFQITGIYKSKKTRKVALEQSKPTSLEQVPEEPSDPLPSVVVDHDRLKVMDPKNQLNC